MDVTEHPANIVHSLARPGLGSPSSDYRHTGRKTITMTVTWTAQFDLGAGWTDLDQPLTGAGSIRALTIKQARAVLVPDPGEH